MGTDTKRDPFEAIDTIDRALAEYVRPGGAKPLVRSFATVRHALLTPGEAAIALGWCDVVDANSPLEPEHEEAALIAKLRRIAGDS